MKVMNFQMQITISEFNKKKIAKDAWNLNLQLVFLEV